MNTVTVQGMPHRASRSPKTCLVLAKRLWCRGARTLTLCLYRLLRSQGTASCARALLAGPTQPPTHCARPHHAEDPLGEEESC